MRARSITDRNLLDTVLAPREEYLKDRAAVQNEANKELARLVQSDSWLYAQRVANEIQKEFECRPNHPDWHVYSTVQYALNQLFERIRVRAKVARNIPSQGSILAEIKERNDSPSRRKSGTSRAASGDGKRRRTG